MVQKLTGGLLTFVFQVYPPFVFDQEFDSCDPCDPCDPRKSVEKKSYGAPYSCRYTLAFRMMACTYSRVSVNGIDSTNSAASRYLP